MFLVNKKKVLKNFTNVNGNENRASFVETINGKPHKRIFEMFTRITSISCSSTKLCQSF